jgi:hypothetical protein
MGKRNQRMRIVFTGSLVFILCRCDFQDDGAIHKLNCSNIENIEVKNYPAEIDSLIRHEVETVYKKDSVAVKILGGVYNNLNLKNCVIDTSVYNAQIVVTTIGRKDYWYISFQKSGDEFKKRNFFKRKGPN